MRENPAPAWLMDHLGGNVTEQHAGRATATEAALISRTGLGDDTAFGTLVSRHRPAVTRLAALLDPDPRHRALVDETFEVAHTTLRLMLGPSESLRPYLLLLACRLHDDHPAGAPAAPLEVEHFSSSVPFREPRDGEMHAAVAVEFSLLPEAWQLLIWQLDVEGDTPEAAAALAGVSANVVLALVEGARAALRRALLTRHRSRTLPPPCLGHTARLDRASRGPVPRVVLRHAALCERCAVLVSDLDAVERDLGAVVVRHLLGRVADDYRVVRRTGAADRAVRR